MAILLSILGSRLILVVYILSEDLLNYLPVCSGAALLLRSGFL